MRKPTIPLRRKPVSATRVVSSTSASGAARKTPRSRLILLGVLCVIVAVVFSKKLTAGLVDSANLDTEQTRERAAAVRQRAEDAAAVRDGRDAFDRRAAQAQAQIPTDVDLGGLIDEVEGAVSSAGMTWLAGTPSDAGVDESSPTASWSLELSAQGPESGVTQLVTNLEDLPRLVRIVSISMQQAEAGQVIVNVSLRFYALEGGA